MIMTGCSLLGFGKVEQMKGYIRNSMLMQRQLMEMTRQIKAGFAQLPEIIEVLAKSGTGKWQGFYSYMGEGIRRREESFGSLWEHAMEKYVVATYIGKEEREIWREFGLHLGYLDQEMQLTLAKLCLEQLEEQMGRRKRQLQEYGRLYQTLGIASGMFLVVILV